MCPLLQMNSLTCKEGVNMKQCSKCYKLYADRYDICTKCNSELIPLSKDYQIKTKTICNNKIQSSQKSTPTIECPYCHSTDTQKISGMSRAGSIVVWGIFSKKLGKQWHCDKCGSDF